MAVRRILGVITWIVVNVTLDLLECAAFFLAVALITILIGLVLPLGVAVAIALLGVSVPFGYRRARAIDRARAADCWACEQFNAGTERNPR